MNHQINIDEAIAIAKEYHLEAEVTECIKQCKQTIPTGM